ncbi:MAG: type III ribulose-bisphosphate carboxylase [Nanoarchaeota archaeon]|nr:type III ribulose-bisphosphate carboxylase [Nanoarchaeota archaeon]
MSQYLDFVDTNYKPTKADLVCLFRFEPRKGVSMKEAIGRIAAESSNGTWTELQTLREHIRKIRARAFSIKGEFVKIAYPWQLFELGSMPQVYSAIVGNIFGMKAVEGLRLEDIEFPKIMVKSFRGPQFGIPGVRKFMKVPKRPLTATVPKPKVGMTTEEHAKVGYDAWRGGVDFLKDDENLTDQVFNRFSARAKLCAKMRDKAEKETGEIKDYFINITAETNEMVRRAKIAQNYGFKYVMVDIVTAGWSGLQTIREHCQDSKQAIHAHRAMHATFTRNPKHGLSMLALAKCARLVGVDNIHIGTAVGKLVSPKQEVIALEREIEDQQIEENLKQKVLQQNWHGIKPVFACSSGGLHPGLIPYVMNMLGNESMVQLGGGIHGHPGSTYGGAKALRQAIDATMNKESLESAAKRSENKELKVALSHFGYERPV